MKKLGAMEDRVKGRGGISLLFEIFFLGESRSQEKKL
jgi:hypothetical protein